MVRVCSWQAGQRQEVYQGSFLFSSGCLNGPLVARVPQFEDYTKVLKLDIDQIQQLTVSRKLLPLALKASLLMTSEDPGATVPWVPQAPRTGPRCEESLAVRLRVFLVLLSPFPPLLVLTGPTPTASHA